MKPSNAPESEQAAPAMKARTECLFGSADKEMRRACHSPAPAAAQTAAAVGKNRNKAWSRSSGEKSDEEQMCRC